VEAGSLRFWTRSTFNAKTAGSRRDRYGSSVVYSVILQGEQPEVRLTVCIDTSELSTRYRANGKAVPMGSGNGTRHKAQARLVFAPPANQKTKMWFLIDEKASGPC
jgi:hypothetical protein